MNEPVTWATEDLQNVMSPKFKEMHMDTSSSTYKQFPVPLYAHPMRDDEDDDIFRKEQVEKFYAEARLLSEKYKLRELTGKEIKKIAIECGAYENEDTGGLITDDICIGSFAEILLKASRGEK
jgi:hypothetical protein